MNFLLCTRVYVILNFYMILLAHFVYIFSIIKKLLKSLQLLNVLPPSKKTTLYFLVYHRSDQKSLKNKTIVMRCDDERNDYVIHSPSSLLFIKQERRESEKMCLCKSVNKSAFFSHQKHELFQKGFDVMEIFYCFGNFMMINQKKDIMKGNVIHLIKTCNLRVLS